MADLTLVRLVRNGCGAEWHAAAALHPETSAELSRKLMARDLETIGTAAREAAHQDGWSWRPTTSEGSAVQVSWAGEVLDQTVGPMAGAGEDFCQRCTARGDNRQ